MKHRLNPAHAAALAAQISQQIGTLYFDMAIVCFPPALAAIQLSHHSSKLIMGFDQPFIPASAIDKARQTLQGFQGFSSEEREQARAEAVSGTSTAYEGLSVVSITVRDRRCRSALAVPFS